MGWLGSNNCPNFSFVRLHCLIISNFELQTHLLLFLFYSILPFNMNTITKFALLFLAVGVSAGKKIDMFLYSCLLFRHNSIYQHIISTYFCLILFITTTQPTKRYPSAIVWEETRDFHEGAGTAVIWLETLLPMLSGIL